MRVEQSSQPYVGEMVQDFALVVRSEEQWMASLSAVGWDNDSRAAGLESVDEQADDFGRDLGLVAEHDHDAVALVWQGS